MDEDLKFVRVIEYIDDQRGEPTPEEILYRDPKTGEKWVKRINCFSSIHHGLGNCQCQTHSPWVWEKE